MITLVLYIGLYSCILT